MAQFVSETLTLQTRCASRWRLADDAMAFALAIGKCFPLEIAPIWGDGIPAIACDGMHAVAPSVPVVFETI